MAPVRVLEIASGSGQHAVFMAENLPSVVWQPTDVDEAALASIDAYRRESSAGARLRAPIHLDVRTPGWRHPTDLVVCINMVHISPWASSEGLFEGAARSLGEGGVLFLYGPYRFHGVFLAPSNEAFDASLRARDPSWGVREVDELTSLGVRHGFQLESTTEMPANNHCLVFRRGMAG